jgi:hypothetical protein
MAEIETNLSKTITTRCPVQVLAWAKYNNVKIPRLLWAGYQKMTGEDTKKLQEMEILHQNLVEKLKKTASRLYELEQKFEQKGGF